MGLADNPVVRLNHAVAVAMVHGPSAAFELLDALQGDDRLARDHRLYVQSVASCSRWVGTTTRHTTLPGGSQANDQPPTTALSARSGRSARPWPVIGPAALMYMRGFRDLDGHQWSFIHMDMSAVPE